MRAWKGGTCCHNYHPWGRCAGICLGVENFKVLKMLRAKKEVMLSRHSFWNEHVEPGVLYLLGKNVRIRGLLVYIHTDVQKLVATFHSHKTTIFYETEMLRCISAGTFALYLLLRRRDCFILLPATKMVPLFWYATSVGTGWGARVYVGVGRKACISVV